MILLRHVAALSNVWKTKNPPLSKANNGPQNTRGINVIVEMNGVHPKSQHAN